jgi:hypothetical protein
MAADIADTVGKVFGTAGRALHTADSVARSYCNLRSSLREDLFTNSKGARQVFAERGQRTTTRIAPTIYLYN